MISHKNKTAVIYRGMYMRSTPEDKAMNFLELIDNNKKLFLQELGEFDLYFDTKSVSPEYDKILKSNFDLKQIRFIDNNKSCMDSISNSLKIADFSEYDLIINLRFGLKFNCNFSLFKVDETKFNFLWREPRHLNRRKWFVRVSDHILMFPSKYLENFNNIDFEDDKMRYENGDFIRFHEQAHYLIHFLNLDMDKEVNFMVEGEHWSAGHENDEVGRRYLELIRGTWCDV